MPTRLSAEGNWQSQEPFIPSRSQTPPEPLEMLDVVLSNWSTRTCDGKTRRDFLRVGSLGLAGLSLASFLRAEASSRNQFSRANSVLLVFLGGGISHHDTFDLKPDAPDDIRGNYQPIQTTVP
ncbi:MAG TPA: hypothetical protein VLM40_12210 [Gemmata sp.]|nr:hypothetical protein [Gemmata sp.]